MGSKPVKNSTGNPVNTDLHGRRINYLRLSITDLCNMRCFYCMPDGVVDKLSHDEILRFNERLEFVEAAASLGISKIRVTGGEPLIKKGIVDFVSDLKAINGVETVVMTTNGSLLEKHTDNLKSAGLAGVNISLDTLDDGHFSEITRGGRLSSVLKGIDAALAAGIPVKINTVLLDGINENSICDFISFAKKHGTGLRFIERMGFDKSTRVCTQDQAIALIQKEFNVEPLDLNPEHPHVQQFSCDGTTIGFISPMSHSFCSGCNKLRLTPEGQLRMCLASEDSIDIREIVRRPHTFEDLTTAVIAAIGRKPDTAAWKARGRMWRVGG